MERRRFLSTVALGAGAAGAGAIWLPGCGAPAAPSLHARQVEDLLGRLEHGLRGVREAPWAAQIGASERVMRVGLEALVVADVARSIPAGTHLPPELADRLGEAVPILDDCVVAYHALLEQTPRSERRKLDERFRAKPRTAMDVAEVMDERAAQIGISHDSRVRLRRVATNVGARVRRQSSSALIDDCVAKMENVVARSGADLHAARSTTTTALIQAIWQQVDGVPPAGGAAGSLGSPTPVVPPAPGEAPPARQPFEALGGRTGQLGDDPRRSSGSPGDTELAVGGVMLGAGLAVFGIGGLISLGLQSIWPIVVAATPAGVAVIIGLILLIVGGVQNANAA